MQKKKILNRDSVRKNRAVAFIEDGLFNAINEVAFNHGRTMSGEIRQAIKAYCSLFKGDIKLDERNNKIDDRIDTVITNGMAAIVPPNNEE